MKTDLLTIKILGTFRLQRNGQEVTGLSRAAKCLLALLILRRDTPQTREALASLIWQDAPHERGLFYLRRSLTELRTALGDERTRLISAADTLRFETEGISCDVLDFERLTAQKEETALEQAAGLYRGTILEGIEADYLTAERERYADQYLGVLESLADLQAERGAWKQALTSLRRIVCVDPLRETAHCRIMEILGSVGDWAGVEKQYRELRRALHSELNLEPSAQTTACYQRLTAQSQEISPAPALLYRLPVPLTPLIGRENECLDITQALHSSRLVTLTGSGGIGKTRLALAVAEKLGAEKTLGICWVELASLDAHSQILPAIAASAGVREQNHALLQDTVIAFFKERHTLLILDNCEHLIEGCAEVSRVLLESCPVLRILATSRQPLRIEGETVRRVPSLPVPPQSAVGAKLEATVAGADAAQLFLQRARAARHEFALTADNAAAIAQVCTTLDGIPLALEIAAVWVRTLTVEQIAERLTDRFALLMTGARTAPARHQTLRMVIEWSDHLLDAKEHELLTQLSIFAGGWTLEAAEAICSGVSFQSAEIVFLLDRLVEQSLVEMSCHNQTPRYRFLETVRQYAQEKLSPDDKNRLLCRHREYFLSFAEALCPRLGKAETVSLCERLTADYENLRLAWHTCHTDPDAYDLELRLAVNMGRFAHFRGSYREGIELLQATLEKSTDADSRSYREGMCQIGKLCINKGDYSRASVVLERAYALACAASDLLQAAPVRRLAGNCLMAQDRNAEAKQRFHDALRISRAAGEECEAARVLMSLGILAKNEGKSAEAIDLLSQASRTFEALGELNDAGIALHNLGNAVREHGQHVDCEQYYLKSLSIHRLLGKQAWQGVNLNELGTQALIRGEYEQARAYAEKTLRLCQDDENMTAIGYHLMAMISLGTGDLRQARQFSWKALRIQHRLGTKRNMSYGFWTKARIAFRSGQKERAAQFLAFSAALREEIGYSLVAEQSEFDATVGEVRAALNEAVFSAAWRQGAGFSLDAAVALALEGVPE